MAKRRMAVIVFLICLCVWLFPSNAMATSISDAAEPINVSRQCTLTLSYNCNGIAFEDVSVKLYKIADVSSDLKYDLASGFALTGLVLNGVKTNDEWNVIRSTLEARIVADSMNADCISKTNSNGLVCFEALTPGLYLAVVGTVTQNGLLCNFDSALIALPGMDVNGHWKYQVAVASKSEIITPSDEEIELKVLKLWKGDEKRNSRPTNIEVEIFRNGASYKRITLSQENNWSYSWRVKDDGTQWTVTEKHTPSGYTMALEKRNNSFVLTNTYTPGNTNEPFDDLQTGDTFNIMLYVILMIVSGSMLILLGIIGKRNSHEETK